jgi:hypothetical protein
VALGGRDAEERANAARRDDDGRGNREALSLEHDR